MNFRSQQSPFSTSSSILLRGVLLAALAAFPPVGFAQQLQADTIPVENWPVHPSTNQMTSSPTAGTTSGLVFIAITPCRVMDTRSQGGSGKTGLFGPPSLTGGQARMVPVPSSNCGIPVAAAYSMNLVSITPPGRPVGWVAAWQNDTPWPGTVVLNALQGGVVGNSAIVPAGVDGGIQLLTTDNADLVIDLNGYYIQATTIQGATGPRGPTGDQGETGATGSIGPMGLAGATGPIGPMGPAGATGAASTVPGPQGPQGIQGPAGAGSAAGTSYLYVYNTAAQVVPIEADIAFDTTGPSAGFTGTTVTTAGTYQVSFHVSGVEPNQFAICVNGVALTAGTFGSGAGTQQNAGNLIVVLAAGDVLSLRNHSSAAAVTLQTLAGGTQTNVNASMLVTRLN